MTLKNGMKLTLYKAQPNDATDLIEYLNIVGGESDNLTFGAGEFALSVEEEERFLENANSSRCSAFFVGRINGEVACTGAVQAERKARMAHQSTLAVSVLKKYWNIGVGTAIMGAMIDFARNTGVTEILHLGVRADNVNAIKLYKKMGFEKIGRYPKFFKVRGEYFDEILMNMYL